MKTNHIIITICALLMAYMAFAQNQPAAAPASGPQSAPAAAVTAPAASAASMPATVTSTTAAPPPAVVTAPAAVQSATASVTTTTTVVSSTETPAQPAAAPAMAPAASGTAAPAAQPAPAVAAKPATPDDTPPTAKNEIRMNFQGAALTDVLNYLSNAAGFVIVQETPVTGTVNVISKQPVTADEAVELLNTVLYSKGYVAIRNGRILKIISKTGAQTNNGIPVGMGNDPDKIPKVDEIKTQIIPIKYMDATKLIENLRPLLSADATINANESSNAILLTDTQANIHRMVEIIHALDTSVSSISTIRVFPLRYADAKDFANVLTQLFASNATGANGQNQGGGGFPGRFGGGRGGGGGGGGGGGAETTDAQSEARKAAMRVIAVPDEQSNSVVVSAPDEYMDTIAEIVTRLDTSTTEVTETRIFRLEHADSVAVSTILNTLYGDQATTNNSNQQQGGGRNGGGGGQQGRPVVINQYQQGSGPSTPSERALQQARVVTVPDPRTNSVIVNCSHDSMEQIAVTIGRLDSTDAKKQHVHTYTLQHADPDSVVPILRSLFNDPTASNTQQSTLTTRQTQGASSDVSNTLGTGGGTGSNNRGTIP